MIEILANSWIMALPFLVVALIGILAHHQEGDPISYLGITGCLGIGFAMGFLSWWFFSDLTHWDQLVASVFGNGMLMHYFYQFADD